MKKIIAACIAIGAVNTTYAALDDYLPPAKLQEHTDKLKMVYGGVGMTNRLVHANAELVTPYGIAYGKVGAFLNGEDLGAQAGFRFPYHFTGIDQNGYYVGAFLGHTENTKLDNERIQRLGGGIDLSYVLLNAQRISTASVGLKFSEKLKGRYGSEKSADPELQFSYSLSFGIF